MATAWRVVTADYRSPLAKPRANPPWSRYGNWTAPVCTPPGTVYERDPDAPHPVRAKAGLWAWPHIDDALAMLDRKPAGHRLLELSYDPSDLLSTWNEWKHGKSIVLRRCEVIREISGDELDALRNSSRVPC